MMPKGTPDLEAQVEITEADVRKWDALEGAYVPDPLRSEKPPEGQDQNWLFLNAHVGYGFELGHREADLVYSTLESIRARLGDDTLTNPIRDLLTGFLQRVIDRKDYNLALEILGKGNAGRVGAPQKDKKILWWEAHSNYEYMIEEGHSDAEALKVTWETLYPDKNFLVETCRPAGEGTTAYAQQIEKIKSLLNVRGSRQAAKRGRKPKIITP